MHRMPNDNLKDLARTFPLGNKFVQSVVEPPRPCRFVTEYAGLAAKEESNALKLPGASEFIFGSKTPPTQFILSEIATDFSFLLRPGNDVA
eukprot:3375322-Heterocapsa_arctica.AAC.1